MIASEQKVGHNMRQLPDLRHTQPVRVPRSLLLAAPLSALLWAAIIAGVHQFI